MKITLVLIFNALFFHLLWGLDFRVSNNADSGPNSLRQAIDDLNASLAESNTITFDAGLGTITLLSDLPLIAIQGTFITAANDALVIDGNAGPYRVFGSQDVNITINASNASILTVSGLIDQGSLICSGAGGTIGLNGINTYTGGTVISSNMILTLSGTGVLDPNGSVVINSSTLDISAITPPSQTITTLSGNGTGEIILGTKALIVNTPITTTYPGIISGTGSFTKQGLGTLVLTGANVYSGGTTVSAGVLQGNTTSLQGNILDNARVVFDQTGVGTYAGIISGSGNVNKQGSGSVNFINNSSAFTGSIVINAGTFLVDGSLGGALTVFPNAILGGNGTVGNVVNNGRTEPGSSIGTLTVNGNYIQGPSGILGIEISETGATDLLQVTGTATLNGVLQISPEPGVYLVGTAYTFLTAGSVTGQFSSSFSDLPLNYTINYFPDRAQLFVLSSSLVLPPRPSGNAGAVADYLFCSSFDFADVDLDTVAESLLILPSGQYKKALNRLTPSQFGSLALTELENNFTIANAFFLARLDQKSCCADMCKSTSIWINPLGSVYSQKSHLEIGQEAIGFTNHTYGVTAGIDHILSNNWNLGLGLGYAHSHVHWKNQAGRAYANSGYLGPCLRYDSQHFYFDFLILGAGNFYDVHRKIQFPGLFRQAKSHPRNWNLSEIVLAGFNLEADANVFVRPEILLDQLNVFQESFCEKGADSINLSVKRKYSSFLRSLINLKIVKEWAFCDTCVVPSVNIGWLRTTPLSGRHYTASFRSDTFCQPNFSVTSFDQIIDQVLVGVQFLIASQGGVAMSLGYDGRFGEGTKVNEINTALDWKF